MANSLYNMRGAFTAYAHEKGFSKLGLLEAVCNADERNSEFYHMGTSHMAGHRQLYASFRAGGQTVHFFASDVESMLEFARSPAKSNDAFAIKFIEEAKSALRDLALYERIAEKISSSYPADPMKNCPMFRRDGAA